MTAVVRSSAFRAWVVLVALTVLGVAAAEYAASAKFAAAVVILIAGIKIDLIGSHFMELNWSSRPWRLLFECWILVVVCIVLGGYWISAL
jgi:heme/copper-type cytochrome/quinol oxidase subunit 4